MDFWSIYFRLTKLACCHGVAENNLGNAYFWGEFDSELRPKRRQGPFEVPFPQKLKTQIKKTDELESLKKKLHFYHFFLLFVKNLSYPLREPLITHLDLIQDFFRASFFVDCWILGLFCYCSRNKCLILVLFFCRYFVNISLIKSHKLL